MWEANEVHYVATLRSAAIDAAAGLKITLQPAQRQNPGNYTLAISAAGTHIPLQTAEIDDPHGWK